MIDGFRVHSFLGKSGHTTDTMVKYSPHPDTAVASDRGVETKEPLAPLLSCLNTYSSSKNKFSYNLQSPHTNIVPLTGTTETSNITGKILQDPQHKLKFKLLKVET